MTAEVYLGLADWGASAADLYPDGLPEEWREAYYATRFSCVWLSRVACAALSDETASRWLADVPERFCFVFEAGCQVPDVLRARAGVGEGVVLWFDQGSDLAVLSAELVRRAASSERLCLLSRDGNLPQVEQVRLLVQLHGL